MQEPQNERSVHKTSANPDAWHHAATKRSYVRALCSFIVLIAVAVYFSNEPDRAGLVLFGLLLVAAGVYAAIHHNWIRKRKLPIDKKRDKTKGTQ